jgi:hypothetical protein
MMASDDPGLACLVVVGPARLAGLVLPLSPPEVVIGHSDTADVVLEHEFVSRRHALVTVDEAGVVTLIDLNSTAGTFVNDVLIDGPCVLRAGDLVRFADLVARFEPGISSAASVASGRTDADPAAVNQHGDDVRCGRAGNERGARHYLRRRRRAGGWYGGRARHAEH